MQGSYALYRCAVLSTSTSSLSDILDRDSPIQILHLGVEMEGRVAADGLEVDNAQYCGWRKNHLNEKVRTIPPTQETLSHTISIFNRTRLPRSHHHHPRQQVERHCRSYPKNSAGIQRIKDLCGGHGHVLYAGRLFRIGSVAPAQGRQKAARNHNVSGTAQTALQHFFRHPFHPPAGGQRHGGAHGCAFERLAGSENGIALYRQRADARRFGIGHRRNDGRGDSLGYAGHARQRQRRFRPGRTLFRQPRVYHHFANRSTTNRLRLGDGVPVSPVVAVHVGFDCIGIGMVERIKD